jgi:phage terminase small subunit
MNVTHRRWRDMGKLKVYEVGDKLTERQDRWIDHYITTGNASEAVRLSGYTTKTPERVGHENLIKLDKIVKHRMAGIGADHASRILTAEEILLDLSDIARDTKKPDNSRLKAYELVGKRHGIFREKIDLTITRETLVEHIVAMTDDELEELIKIIMSRAGDVSE